MPQINAHRRRLHMVRPSARENHYAQLYHACMIYRLVTIEIMNSKSHSQHIQDDLCCKSLAAGQEESGWRPSPGQTMCPASHSLLTTISPVGPVEPNTIIPVIDKVFYWLQKNNKYNYLNVPQIAKQSLCDAYPRKDNRPTRKTILDF